MNASDFFNTYIAGFILNVLAGIVGFFLIRKLFAWLPTSEELSGKFRAVKQKGNAKEKITSLTPLIFISFYWIFLANMLWIVLYIIVEILWWPELMVNLKIPQINEYLERMQPGLVIGRSILFVLGCMAVAICFYRGAKIARQCWEVYRATDIE